MWDGISGLFWFAFPWWLRMLSIFSGASQPFGIPQVRILCLALSPIFNGVIWFSVVHLLDFFIYIGYQSPLWFRIGKDPFPICWWSFLSYWLCLLPGRSFAILWGLICRFSILTAQAIADLFRIFAHCTHIFEAFPYFLLHMYQYVWFYVEFLNPLKFDLSTRR